jgi:hypothetical protein
MTILKTWRGGRNVKNHNIEWSERWKFLKDDQNVENHFVENMIKNHFVENMIESHLRLSTKWSFLKNQNWSERQKWPTYGVWPS